MVTTKETIQQFNLEADVIMEHLELSIICFQAENKLYKQESGAIVGSSLSQLVTFLWNI
jgi:hypothetical protein